MHIPVVDEHEERFPVRHRPDPVNRRVVQLFLSYRSVKEMVQARIDDVLITAPKPYALSKQGIDRASRVSLFQQNFRQKRRSPGKLRFSAMGYYAMRERVLPREDGGMRWLRWDGRGEYIFT